MSFLPNVPPRVLDGRVTPKPNGHAKDHPVEVAGVDPETFYRDLIDQRPALIEEKLKLHARIIDEFNLTVLEKLPRAELVKQVHAYVANYVRTEKISLNQKELTIFSEEIIDEMTGYGPIEPLLKDPTVTDILINTHKVCFVEKFGKLYETKVHFKDEAHLLQNHRQDCRWRRASDRQIFAYGRRPVARRNARERRNTADCHRRTVSFDPKILRATV